MEEVKSGKKDTIDQTEQRIKDGRDERKEGEKTKKMMGEEATER